MVLVHRRRRARSYNKICHGIRPLWQERRTSFKVFLVSTLLLKMAVEDWKRKSSISLLDLPMDSRCHVLITFAFDVMVK